MSDYDRIPVVRIRSGKEKQLVRRHPWVFSGAIDQSSQRADESIPTLVRVEDVSGSFIAYGWHDSLSHIPVRLLSWDDSIVPDIAWWARMVSESVRRRARLFGNTRTSAFRLIHGEADFIPGLTADLYGTTIICLVSARIAWEMRAVVVQTLQKLLNPSLIVVSTDSAFCGIEHMKLQTEYYEQGALVDTPSISHVSFQEHGLHFTFEIGVGQKSGFYCDQRENRRLVASYTENRTVLDTFCYTGAFSLYALASRARSVTAVDSSKQALETFARQLAANVDQKTIPTDAKSSVTLVKADVFSYLREIDAGVYDCIILDPPKLAQTKGQVARALRAYKDLNRLAMEKVRPGGIVATFSCSGGVSREQLQTVLAWAAKDTGKEVQMLEVLGQPADHPIRLSFPESEYLKGFIFSVL